MLNTSLLSAFWDREKQRLRVIFLATLFWGLIAHGYALLNFTISHDSMNEFYAFSQMGYYSGTAAQWKIALGRFFAPVYQLIFRGETVAPWFSGLLALLWIGLAVWVTAQIFDIRSRGMLILTSGIFTVNLSVIALTAGYLHDLDADMFAVLLAVLAVLLWKRGGKGSLLAVPALILAMSIYQSMLSMYISFVIFVSILYLLAGRDVKAVFADGMKAIGLMAVGGVLYFVISKLVCSLCGITLTQQENGMANMLSGGRNLVSLLTGTFLSWADIFVFCIPRTNLLPHIFLFLAALWAVVTALRSKELTMPAKLLTVALGILMPFGMNVAAFLNNGEVHLLMLLAGWFVYLLVLLLCRSPKMKLLCMALVCLILFSNVRFANEIYTRKDIERQATLACMTRVVDRLEQEEDYLPGITQVVILGTPQVSAVPGYRESYDLTGSLFPTPITTEDFYGAYFRYVLRYPIQICDPGRRAELAAQADGLDAFPAKNCITWIDGVLVLKMS